MPAGIIDLLTVTYGLAVTAEDVLAYIGAIAAHSACTARFQSDLVQPGLRIPLTASATLFGEAVKLGKEPICLHTFGERFISVEEGRPAGPPRRPLKAVDKKKIETDEDFVSWRPSRETWSPQVIDRVIDRIIGPCGAPATAPAPPARIPAC